MSDEKTVSTAGLMEAMVDLMIDMGVPQMMAAGFRIGIMARAKEMGLLLLPEDMILVEKESEE